MSQIKKLTIEVDYNCWKELRIIALQKDTTLQNIVRDILEKATNIKDCSKELKHE